MIRNSINGTWLFGIVITFMAIFIAFITISINYSEAYQMKTKMVTVLEQYDGFNPMSLEIINKISSGYGYRKTNRCKTYDGQKTIGILNGTVNISPSTPQHICISRELKSAVQENAEDKYYYNLEVFFGFNLPILGDVFTFRVAGETNAILYPAESDYFN